MYSCKINTWSEFQALGPACEKEYLLRKVSIYKSKKIKTYDCMTLIIKVKSVGLTLSLNDFAVNGISSATYSSTMAGFGVSLR